MTTGLWKELVEKFTNSIQSALEILKTKNIDNVPGAKDQLIRRFEELGRYLPKNDGELLIKSVDESIANSFFPKTNTVEDAFEKILKARTHDQDYIISELVNGFIASQAKSFGSFKEGPIIDKIIEAFKKSNQFRISDYQLYAMYGNPNKPRKHITTQLKKITEFMGLIEEKMVINRDIQRSEKKIITFYSFPPEIRELLEGTYLMETEKGETIVNEDFDKNVFICFFLAHYSMNRHKLDAYKINGICAIFALILILSFMPKVKLSEGNPILRDPAFDQNRMSVIPKSWMMKDVLTELLPAIIEIIAYRLGATVWYEKIEKSDAQKRLHLQTRFLIKDVNKWVLGNLCRVEIPIFVEISNIFQEVTVGTDSGTEEN
jgi:hypothetical protein